MLGDDIIPRAGHTPGDQGWKWVSIPFAAEKKDEKWPKGRALHSLTEEKGLGEVTSLPAIAWSLQQLPSPVLSFPFLKVVLKYR